MAIFLILYDTSLFSINSCAVPIRTINFATTLKQSCLSTQWLLPMKMVKSSQIVSQITILSITRKIPFHFPHCHFIGVRMRCQMGLVFRYSYVEVQIMGFNKSIRRSLHGSLNFLICCLRYTCFQKTKPG